jgi:hypothetical protein
MRNPFDVLLNKIPKARTGYQALIDDVLICGCNECRHNLETPLVSWLPPPHVCDARINDHGNFVAILDPHNIPSDCPFAVIKA